MVKDDNYFACWNYINLLTIKKLLLNSDSNWNPIEEISKLFGQQIASEIPPNY